MPRCPSCGRSRFRRDSIFTARQEHGAATSEYALPARSRSPDWMAPLRRSLRPGDHLAWRDEEGPAQSFAIERGWTRIGRSESADVQLDDPTVSRRHALVVAEPGRELRVFDDRSLNGVQLNGRPVELAPLGDGDELGIGRFRLHLLRA